MDFSKKMYGLILPKKCAEPKPVVNKTSIFGNDEDSDEDRPLPKLQKNESKKILMKKQTQLDIEKALQEDPNAFAYDDVYDQVQAQKMEKDAAEKANVDRKPKFIGSLLKAADLRKKEDERRLERTVQREREAEKGLFDDKDAFVTESFRKKMREMKEEEERERKKQESEEQNDVTKTGDYSGFYRNMLNKRVGQNENLHCKVKAEPEDKELEEGKENTKVGDELVTDKDEGLQSTKREGDKHFHHGRTKHTDKDVQAEDGRKKRSYRTSKDDDRNKRGRGRRSSESDSDVDKRKSHKEKLDVVESRRTREEERRFAGGTRKDERSKRRRGSGSENDESRTHKEERQKRRRDSSAENNESRTQREERQMTRRGSSSENDGSRTHKVERQKRRRGSSAENGGSKRQMKESTRKLTHSSRSESDRSRTQNEERRKKRRDSSSESDVADDERRHPKKKAELSCPPPQQHTGDTDDPNDSSSSSDNEQHKTIASSEDKELEEMAPEKPSAPAAADVKDMFAKKNEGAAFSDAQARYFARKHAVTAAVAKE